MLPAAGSVEHSVPWSTLDATELYGIDLWGSGYFHINVRGEVCIVDPDAPASAPVSLLSVVQALHERGLEMPVLLRIENILDHRIKVLNEAFGRAIEACGYQNVYRGVFPIKVNQQRHVVEEIARHGALFHHGLEAGSKAELLIALALLADLEAPIVCNGFKDAEFIQLGLHACQLGIRCFFVAENTSEVRLIVAQSGRLGIRPRIGLRIKLSTRVDGHWQADSGDRSIFGLSNAELIEVVELLKRESMLDCLQLLHAHIGSQIPNIQNVRAGVSEATRYYVDLVREGAAMGFLDLGGGLGVDYDGSATNTTHSMNYRLDEYCADMLDTLVGVLDTENIAHPVLITESGRATVAYSSILLFNTLEVSTSEPVSMDVPDSSGLPEPVASLRELLKQVQPRNLQKSYNDANYFRDEVREGFRRGELTLREMAVSENLWHHIVQRILLELPNTPRVPPALQGLAESMADIYYGNLSVFQSLPDTWAIEQVFPVMPIHRLAEKPDRIGYIADITCDSDGRINRFASPSGDLSTLPLHPLRKGEEYYLGVFLVGAYQETLGDLHNLFGDTNVATIRLDGQGGYEIERELAGDRIADVLSYVEYDPQLLSERFRNTAEKAVREGRLSVAHRQAMVRAYNDSLQGYTYFER